METKPIWELYINAAEKNADYAGAMGFAQASLQLLINYAKDENNTSLKEDVLRLSELALTQIEFTFNKYKK